MSKFLKYENTNYVFIKHCPNNTTCWKISSATIKKDQLYLGEGVHDGVQDMLELLLVVLFDSELPLNDENLDLIDVPLIPGARHPPPLLLVSIVYFHELDPIVEFFPHDVDYGC